MVYHIVMKLSAWAKKQGVSYQTSWNLFKAGKIEGAYKLGSGTIIVPDTVEERKDIVVVYARVSSSENKRNLDSQAKRLRDFCSAKGWVVSQVVKEIGSGLNDKRKKLEGILLNETVTKIVVEHKDRFARFGFNYIEKILKMQGREIVVINDTQENTKEDLMSDFVSIITSFVARLYGLRRSKRKTEKLIEELKQSD